MKKITKTCETYIYKFPKPSSFTEGFFSPLVVVRKDGTMVERMQRWLIDTGDFHTTASKSLNYYSIDHRHSKPRLINDKASSIYNFLDHNFLVESVGGHLFYILVTSMLLRSIELISQSAKNPLNFSSLHPKTREIINLLITPAVIGFTLCLGYSWSDIVSFTVFPVLFEKALSFAWSNYFKQIHTLSSTKDFGLRDFIFKNAQVFVVRMLVLVYLILNNLSVLFNKKDHPARMIICKTGPEQFHIHDFHRASSDFKDALLEIMTLVLGKMIFDLAYILMLKAFVKDADLRDPMSWMFSKFKNQVPQPDLEQQKNYNPKKSRKSDMNHPKRFPNAEDKLPSETSMPNISNPNRELNETKKGVVAMESNENEQRKLKVKTTGKGYFVPKARKFPTEIVQTSINIEVGGYVRTFEKIESSSFNEDVWGVIIADSVENQKLTKYERLLSNATIGGGIRQLKGGCYEIGTTMDSRLIGKMYHNGVYNSLQNFMRLEDALHVSQELERQGIPDNIGLIVFSAEAKTHDDIARVANKL